MPQDRAKNEDVLGTVGSWKFWKNSTPIFFWFVWRVFIRKVPYDRVWDVSPPWENKSPTK